MGCSSLHVNQFETYEAYGGIAHNHFYIQSAELLYNCRAEFLRGNGLMSLINIMIKN